ncbi:MAG: nucleoside hydrolase [Anaerolineae bacterium]
MKRLIIDTDPGIDDAHAIMMAFACPEARVEAITTVAGNVGVDLTTANACKVLDVIGADVPVYRGCSRPLVLGAAEDAAAVHGRDGLGDAGIPPSSRQVMDEHASAALVRMAHENPGELTLVCIGPLTNLAVALRLDPGLPGRLAGLVVMGGAVFGRGNTANISAEYNVYSDPEAAHVVFDEWPHLTLIPWETTVAYPIPEDMFNTWCGIKSSRAAFFERISRRLVDFIHSEMGVPVLFTPDALAVAAAVNPAIVTRTETHLVMVELHGRHTRGQTTVDWDDVTGRRAAVSLVLEIDFPRFCAMFEAGLA